MRSNSSNTSRRAFSDFQTPRGVENTRRSRVFFNEFRGVLKLEEVLLQVLERASQTNQDFARKSRRNLV